MLCHTGEIYSRICGVGNSPKEACDEFNKIWNGEKSNVDLEQIIENIRKECLKGIVNELHDKYSLAGSGKDVYRKILKLIPKK